MSIGLSAQEKKFKIDFQHGSYGDHLGFPIRRISAFFIYKSPRYFLSSFESIGPSVQVKKFKIDFQDGNSDGHLGFLIRMILAFIIYKSLRSALILPFKIDFQDGDSRTLLAIFNLQVFPILPTKFCSQLSFQFKTKISK